MWHTGYKHPADEWKSFEEAQQAQESFENENPDLPESDLRCPIFQWHAIQCLKAYQHAYETGNEFALLQAIRVCANFDIPLPEWASHAYIKAFDAVLNCKKKSWDDAFGKPYPKGTNLKALHKKRTLKFGVFNEISGTLKRRPQTPIDENLFEKIGKKFNIGKTLASEYYYEVKKQTLSNSDNK